MTRQHWGIVGLGTIGRLCYDIVSGGGIADVLVGAVTDTAASQRSGFDGSVAVYSNHHQLLASDVDAVLIATPPDSHYQIALDALEAGKDVLVEKPPATTARECQELASRGAHSGRVLFFAFHARYNEAVERAREELAGRRVEEVRVAYQEDVLRFHRADSWVHAQGVLRDSGINVLSVLTRVLSDGTEMVPVSAVLADVNPSGGEDRASLRLSLGGQSQARIDLDWRHKGQERRHLTFVTGAGELTVDVSLDRLYRNGKLLYGGDVNRDGMREEYTRMLDHFRQCVQERRSWCSCAELGAIEAARALSPYRPNPHTFGTRQ